MKRNEILFCLNSVDAYKYTWTHQQSLSDVSKKKCKKERKQCCTIKYEKKKRVQGLPVHYIIVLCLCAIDTKTKIKIVVFCLMCYCLKGVVRGTHSFLLLLTIAQPR